MTALNAFEEAERLERELAEMIAARRRVKRATPVIAAAAVRRGHCTPGCLIATGPAHACQCACRGRYHGQLATVLLTDTPAVGGAA